MGTCLRTELKPHSMWTNLVLRARHLRDSRLDAHPSWRQTNRKPKGLILKPLGHTTLRGGGERDRTVDLCIANSLSVATLY